MRYSELTDAVRERLEANFAVLIKYSDAAGVPRDTVLSTMLVSMDSKITPREMVGFDYRGSATDAFRQWFEHSTAAMGDDEAQRYALHSLMAVDPEFAEPLIRELESAAGIPPVDPMTEAKEAEIPLE